MYKGFVLSLGERDLFLISDNKNITKVIVDKFIDKIGMLKGVTKEVIEMHKANEQYVNNIRFHISKATLEKVDNGRVSYYDIKGDDFTCGCMAHEANEKLVIFR